MPSTPSNDDQFADLFSKLPTPPERSGRRATLEETAPTTTQPAPSDPRPAATPTDATGAPLSRRAARAAAAREADTPFVPQPASAADYPVRTAATASEPDAAHASASSVATHVTEAPVDDAPTPATIDALFAEEARHEREAKHDRDRRKSRVAAWTIFGVVLALIGGLVYGGFWVWNTYEEPIRDVLGWSEPKDYEAGIAEGEATVTIVTGDTGATISETLYDAGVTKTPGVFYDYLIGTGQNPNFVPGLFTLQQKMTAAAALEAIMDPANRRENTAQLPEGLTVEQSLPRLADGIGIPLEDFEAAVADPSVYGVDADSLEGWLFPATYTFDDGVTAEDVIRTLVNRTVASLDEAGVPEERRHEILTIASIIEREARFENDFYMVSQVIQNRLQPGNTETSGLLQMDSTAQFGFGQHADGSVSTTDEAQYDDNPWNTYVHPGLPIGPIANPGDRAIDAAMNPADGPWMYFVTVNPSTGETKFAETLAEHEVLVEEFRRYCSENPDTGDC